MIDPSAIDQVFADLAKPGSAGSAVGVFLNGQLEYAAGYGLADLEHEVLFTPQTVVNLGSMAKQFTAFLAALLDDEGALSLDDDIRLHLPELHDFGHVITVRHLVHHLSGLRDTYPDLFVLGGWRMSDLMTRKDVLQLMVPQQELNYQPGEEFLYVNSGYALLALIVERAAGTSFAELARQRIFAPLGMTSTMVKDDYEALIPGAAGSYYQTDDGIWKRLVVTDSSVGPTNVWSTVEDLAHWDRNFLTGEVGGRSLVQRLAQPVQLNDGTPVGYGFGLEVGPERTFRGWNLIEHGGQHGGHCGSLLRFPDAKLSVVVLFNAFRWNTREYAIQVADLFLEDQSGARPEKVAPPIREEIEVPDLGRFAGTYLNRARAAVRRVAVEGDHLTYDGFELLAVEPNRFRFEIEPTVELQFDGSGEQRTVTTVTTQGSYIYSLVPAPEIEDARMALLPGGYVSPELGVQWKIDRVGNQYVVHRHRYPDTVLTPVFADGFTDDWAPVVGFPMSFLVIVQRNAAGDITGFTVSGDRVRNLRFDRL